MSHFVVWTAHKEGENPEDMLAPYQENNMGDCPEEYLQFETEVEAKDIKKECERLVKENGKNYIKLLKAKKYDEILENYYGGEKDKETGDWGYVSNPNSMWDWYVMGGRWMGYFKAKTGKKGITQSTIGPKGWYPKPRKGWYDQLKVKDIDWQGMREQYRADAKKYWDKNHPRKDWRKNYKSWKEYIKAKREDTRENASFFPHAYIEDGEWIESGSMGWFGCVTGENDKYPSQVEKFIEKLDPEAYLTAWDCHI